MKTSSMRDSRLPTFIMLLFAVGLVALAITLIWSRSHSRPIADPSASATPQAPAQTDRTDAISSHYTDKAGLFTFAYPSTWAVQDSGTVKVTSSNAPLASSTSSVKNSLILAPATGSINQAMTQLLATHSVTASRAGSAVRIKINSADALYLRDIEAGSTDRYYAISSGGRVITATFREKQTPQAAPGAATFDDSSDIHGVETVINSIQLLP